MTFGADGTTHRSIHHTARHAHLKTRDYSADDPAAIKRSTRLLGVHPALDGSSEQSVKEWKEVLTDIANIYHLQNVMAIYSVSLISSSSCLACIQTTVPRRKRMLN